MYREFFNFSAEPFRVTPDPGFLYLTDQHKEALAAIIYGIAKRKGFVCITGEVGVGKTTILRSYLDSVDEPGLRFVYIFNPNVSFQTLLRTVFKELGIVYPGEDIAGMVEALRVWLTEHHRRRETLVLLIDEAQNMPIGTLECLRMLSNLETATEKMVQTVLVGQPELENLLAERQLRQLESRIAVRTRLGPLSKTDSLAYIRHRLKCVALDDRPAFTEAALKEIVRQAGGIPRRINVIADNALMTAYGHKARPVPASIVRDVVREMRARDRGILPRVLPWRTVAISGGALAAAGLVLAGGMWVRDELPQLASSLARPEVAAEVALPLPPPVAKAEAMVSSPAAPEPPRTEPPAALPPAALPPAAPPPAANSPSAKPSVVASSAAAIADLGGEAAPKRVLRIVAPGDTLAGLTFQVYGKVDGNALKWVKEHNPGITNVDRIQVGQIIEFPAAPTGGWD
ncbi:MAG: AAA family ATPase [Solirubrobacterales bacterium]